MKIEQLRHYYNFIVFLVVCAYFVTVFIQNSIESETGFTEGQTLLDIQNEWIDEEGNQTDLNELEKLPDADSDGRISIYYDLPESLEDNVNVMFLGSNVFVEGFVVLENGTEVSNLGYWQESVVSSVGKSYGSAFCNFDIKRDFAGKRVKLSADLIYADSGKLDNVMLGNRGVYITEFIADHALVFILSVVTIIIGMVLLLLALASSSDKRLRMSMFSFVMCALFIGIWGISETHVFQLLVGNASLWRITDYLVLIVLPYMLIAAVNGVLRKMRRIYNDIAIIMFVSEVVLVTAGWICFGWDFHDFKPFIHFMMLAAAAIIAFMTIMDRKNRKEDDELNNSRYNMLVFSEVMFILCGIADLIRHYSAVFESDDALLILRIGFLIFELAMFYRYVIMFRDSTRQMTELDVFHKLAFVDGLTGLGNRNAYLRKEEELSERLRNEPDLIVVACSLDMDYLKRLNDNYGHAVGDKYLKAAAAAIQRGFGPNNRVFRCGGDEFGVFVCGKDAELRVLDYLENMVGEIAEINQDKKEYPEPLSISYGYARVEGATANLEKCEARADSMMYDMKRSRKAMRD